MTMAVLLILAAGTAASGAPQTIRFTESGFALQLPEAWLRVPDEVLQDKMNQLNQAYAGDPPSENLSYDHAVQLRSNQWFEYPYMLIREWTDRRVPPADIPKMNNQIEKRMQRSRQGLTHFRMTDSRYHPEHPLYTAEFRFSLADHPMVLLYAARYTNKGILTFSTYMPPAMYDRYAPDIRDAVQTVTLSPENVYQPNHKQTGISFKTHILPYLKVIIATGILLLLTLLFIGNRRGGNGK